MTQSTERMRYLGSVAYPNGCRMGRYKDYHREPKRGGYDDDQKAENRPFGGRPNYPNPSASQASEPLEATAHLESSAERRLATPSQVVGRTKESIGTVKMYKADKGFGFVGQDGGGKDVFVHATALARAGLSGLAEGQRVRMQIGQGKKGLEAQTIELLD